MTDIPDDVMKVARNLYCTWDLTPGMIARAIMAERERAAKVAKVQWLKSEYGSIADADAVCAVCEDIAAAIRKGDDMTRPERRRELQAEREAEERAEHERQWRRITECWQVPARAASEYVALEDAVGDSQAKAILDLITVLYGEPT